MDREISPEPTESVGAGRYAPSPTGELHLGNLRTAVLAWLFARSTGRRFLLRIEDLDASRARPGLAEQQRADLAALGITFDGPVIIQSERRPFHNAALNLIADQTYECFCTRREIAEAAAAPHGGVHYPGTCRDLTDEQRSVARLTRSPAWRLRANQAPMTVYDTAHGEVSGVADDLVVRRTDGGPSYHLAMVVDDAAARVDQVVRGEDLLDSAISQAYLATRLGVVPPTYVHVPLAVNHRGRRLAKRDGAVTLSDLAGQGVGTAEALALILRSLGLPPTSSLDQVLPGFDPATLPRRSWIVDPDA